MPTQSEHTSPTALPLFLIGQRITQATRRTHVVRPMARALANPRPSQQSKAYAGAA